MDQITLTKIELMHPSLRQKTKQDYIAANNVLGKGVRLRYAHTWRGEQLQNIMFAQGRTTPGKIITFAQWLQSSHNYGGAFDTVLLYDKNGDGIFEEASWDTKRDGDNDFIADWTEVTKVLESRGWANGFIKKGKKWDLPHWQPADLPHWKVLKARYEQEKHNLIEGKYISSLK